MSALVANKHWFGHLLVSFGRRQLPNPSSAMTRMPPFSSGRRADGGGAWSLAHTSWETVGTNRNQHWLVVVVYGQDNRPKLQNPKERRTHSTTNGTHGTSSVQFGRSVISAIDFCSRLLPEGSVVKYFHASADHIASYCIMHDCECWSTDDTGSIANHIASPTKGIKIPSYASAICQPKVLLWLPHLEAVIDPNKQGGKNIQHISVCRNISQTHPVTRSRNVASMAALIYMNMQHTSTEASGLFLAESQNYGHVC